ncbi:hypothetical protein L3049_06305 [Labilibaculum sp. DW002]|uniref:Uncharacterized protein n=1 Tax=Paralabilibaculum antarcticum TaxID=2912572 RepID=A0ABT5VQQ9_9BACT|nr:hypothetical protein [Labilibaculum sp. DW002]MDE5417616.1 hypothetical protein [Labilibaculum sp. DW002]
MKANILITILLLFMSTIGFTQIKYEGKINSKYKSIKLDDGSIKYVKYDKKNQTIFIHNIDNSLWRSVKLPLPKNHLLDEIKLISQTTFNKDEKVELVYSCVEYLAPENYEDPSESFVSINFTLNVITETGESLLKVDNSNEMEIIHTKGQTKMLIYKHVGESFNNNDETLIYNLP